MSIVGVAIAVFLLLGAMFLDGSTGGFVRGASDVRVRSLHATMGANVRDAKRLTSKLNHAQQLPLSAGSRASSVQTLAPSVDDDTIFVSVASFRDPQCPRTVNEMLSKAKNPRRVILGIIEQHGPEDGNSIPPEYEVCDPFAYCPRDNIRVRRVLPVESKGPTFGRFVSSLMYRGEKYFMMIDSHNLFINYWDSVILANYLRAPGAKTVLSHYPNGHDAGKRPDESMIMVMCKAIWVHELHYPRNGAQWTPVREDPYPQSFTAAGFLFGNASLLAEAPFDPYLDYLFDGEELLFTIRLWTHGWDIFGPSKAVLFHDYNRHTAKRFWHEKVDWAPVQRISQKRVQYLLKSTFRNSTTLVVPDARVEDPRVSVEEAKYGLGKVRTLADFWKHVHIDPVQRSDGADLCDSRRWGR